MNPNDSYKFNIFRFGMNQPYKILVPKSLFSLTRQDIKSLPVGEWITIHQGDGWDGLICNDGHRVGVKIYEKEIFNNFSQTIWI